jgi:hypothetical protein
MREMGSVYLSRSKQYSTSDFKPYTLHRTLGMGLAGIGTEAADIPAGTGLSREALHSVGSCGLSFRCHRIPQIRAS